MNKDVRWKQRFQNFEKAFLKLKEAVDMEELSELEENGLIQRFEFTIELCWNILKDFMEEEGVQIKLVYPKEIIREAGKVNLLDDPQTLINALTLRNELSHDYDCMWSRWWWATTSTWASRCASRSRPRPAPTGW